MIHVYVDRGNFIRNPTSCKAMQIANTLTGAGANVADPAGQTTVTRMTRVANCASLGFKPIFKAATSSKTSRRDGASLTVKIVEGIPGEANIAKVKVSLPQAASVAPDDAAESLP